MDAKQEPLGFSTFQLVYVHTVHGPLKVLKEKWLGSETETSLLNGIMTDRTNTIENQNK